MYSGEACRGRYTLPLLSTRNNKEQIHLNVTNVIPVSGVDTREEGPHSNDRLHPRQNFISKAELRG